MTTIQLQQPIFRRPPVALPVTYVRFGLKTPGKLPFTRAMNVHKKPDYSRPASPDSA